MVKCLIKRRANTNKPDEFGNTPFLLAVLTGNLEIAEVLAEHRADINQPDAMGRTPLAIAEKEGNLDMVELLLKKGVSLTNIELVRRTFTSLIRKRRIGVFEILNKSEQLNSLRNDLRNILSHDIQQSCFQKSDSLESIDLSLISTKPLTVAQNYCDSLVRLKDGSLLKIKGKQSEEVYTYLREKLNLNSEQGAPFANLVVYLNPGHSFFGLESPTGNQLFGFYPNTSADAIIPDDYFTEVTVGSILGATTFCAFYTLINIPLSLAGYRHNKCLTTLLPVIFSGMATPVLYEYISRYFSVVDHRIGKVENEYDAQQESITQDRLVISVVIDQAQTNRILEYIDSMSAACNARQLEHCTFHFFARNCVSFTQEVFRAAGFKEGTAFDFFSEEQLGQVDYGSYSSVYSQKALFYAVLLKKWRPN